jgi:hypothetical protein
MFNFGACTVCAPPHAMKIESKALTFIALPHGIALTLQG